MLELWGITRKIKIASQQNNNLLITASYVIDGFWRQYFEHVAPVAFMTVNRIKALSNM